jgi:hypothetical protein
VNNAPPSGLQITEHGPIIQDLYKQLNKKDGSKGLGLHHCYKDLDGNAKWVRRNFETTPKRSRIIIAVDADEE